MIKKIKFCFFILLIIFPTLVFAAAFEGNFPNRYYGYFETLQLNNENVMLSYFNNGWIDDDQYSSLQQLSSGLTNDYRIALSTYGIYAPDISEGLISGLNDSNLRYFEQDICVSSNKISFQVVNGSSQDFATNKNPLAIITSDKCDLYGENVPSGVQGPTYWSWLENYQGYVVKLFLPIAQWKVLSSSDHSWQVVSRLYVKNESDYTLYYRFLTTGGLYDHSRYFEINDSFDLDTKNFDLTYDAIMDGVGLLDDQTHIKYQISKNLADIDFTFDLNDSQPGSMQWSYFTSGYIPVTVGNYCLSEYFNGILYYGRIHGYAYVYTFDSSKNLISNVDFISTLANDRNCRYLNDENVKYFVVRVAVDNYSIGDNIKIQLERNSYVTSFCPYGPTLDNNCVSHYVDAIISWDENDLSNNISNILNLPIKLSQYVLLGAEGNCQPLSFILFNHEINVPCGSFFWAREDVQDFRIVWNLLFGGFIIFKLVLWDLRVIASVVDPMGDSVGLGIDLIDVSGSREIRSSKLGSIRRKNGGN